MLITLQQAKDHLRVDFDDLDSDIIFKTEQASALCLKFLKLPENSFLDSSGQPENVPFYLSAAVCVWLDILFTNRGVNANAGAPFGYIPLEVSNILWPYRQFTVR